MLLNTNLCYKRNLCYYPWQTISNMNSDVKITVKNSMPIISMIYSVKYYIGRNLHTINSPKLTPGMTFPTSIPKNAAAVTITMSKYVQHGKFPLICTKFLQHAVNSCYVLHGIEAHIFCTEVPCNVLNNTNNYCYCCYC